MELKMNFETLQVSESSSNSLIISMHRPEQRNSINAKLLLELHEILDIAERDSQYRFIVLQGENGVFCTGMDFHEMTQSTSADISNEAFTASYMSLLKRFTSTPKIIISLLDGQVLAGGMGIAAASDIVLSTHRTTFALSEALWGLLPACVMPFLIRRVGFQKAYFMTLSTHTVSAPEAHTMGLIDDLTDNLNENLRRLIMRLNRINQETVSDLKSYFRKMWIITDAMESTAINEISRLVALPRVKSNIKNFIDHQQFPWERAQHETS